jgi:hypothetical protein
VALSEILDEMADQIRTALAGADWEFQVEPRMVLSPTTPSIDIYPADPARADDLASFGADAADMQRGYWVNVRARVAPNDHESGQEVLLELKDDMSELCLVQALYDDPTLNGQAVDVELDNETGFTLFSDLDPAKVYIGVLWRFLVIPAHS